MNLLSTALITGCATNGGFIGATPEVRQPQEAATLTILRDKSWVGLGIKMDVKLDKRSILSLGRGESFDLKLDPGGYLLEYTIGLNECGRTLFLKPREHRKMRLVPNCMLIEE